MLGMESPVVGEPSNEQEANCK